MPFPATGGFGRDENERLNADFYSTGHWQDGFDNAKDKSRLTRAYLAAAGGVAPAGGWAAEAARADKSRQEFEAKDERFSDKMTEARAAGRHDIADALDLIQQQRRAAFDATGWESVAAKEALARPHNDDDISEYRDNAESARQRSDELMEQAKATGIYREALSFAQSDAPRQDAGPSLYDRKISEAKTGHRPDIAETIEKVRSFDEAKADRVFFTEQAKEDPFNRETLNAAASDAEARMAAAKGEVERSPNGREAIDFLRRDQPFAPGEAPPLTAFQQRILDHQARNRAEAATPERPMPDAPDRARANAVEDNGLEIDPAEEAAHDAYHDEMIAEQAREKAALKELDADAEKAGRKVDHAAGIVDRMKSDLADKPFPPGFEAFEEIAKQRAAGLAEQASEKRDVAREARMDPEDVAYERETAMAEDRGIAEAEQAIERDRETVETRSGGLDETTHGDDFDAIRRQQQENEARRLAPAKEEELTR